jgi:hypothetical protein
MSGSIQANVLGKTVPAVPDAEEVDDKDEEEAGAVQEIENEAIAEPPTQPILRKTCSRRMSSRQGRS